MPLKILTLNCRGLHKNLKRKNIFSKCKNYDVCCLQETYISAELYNKWKKEWSGHFYYNLGTSHSNGLIILTKSSIYFDEQPKLISSNHRILVIDLKKENHNYLIVNLYAPNKKKDKIFFLKLYVTVWI